MTSPRSAMGRTCAVHVHRSIVPLEVHHVLPLQYNGPDVPANKVTVCSNGHSSIHDLLSKMLKGPVPWTVRIHYGWRIRRLARRGYDQIKSGYPSSAHSEYRREPAMANQTNQSYDGMDEAQLRQQAQAKGVPNADTASVEELRKALRDHDQ